MMQKMEVEIGDVIERLRVDLPSILNDQFGETLTAFHLPRFVGRRYSSNAFLRVDVQGGTREFFVKQIIQHPMNVVALSDEPDQASIEYRMLERLYPQFLGVEHCAVPRPVVLYSDAGAYVTEVIDARDLVGDMRLIHYGANRRQFVQLEHSFHHSGRWLRHFQGALTTHLSGAEVASYLLRRCLDRVVLVGEKGSQWVDPQFASRAREYVESLFASIDTSAIAVVARHGDFGPWNTLVNADGITVIDFFGAGDGPHPEDLMSVLVWLDSLRYSVVNSGRRIDRLAQAFLAGFGPVRAQQAEFVLLCEALQRLLRIAVAIQSYLSDADRRVRWPERIERRRNLDANVQWFRARPKQSAIWPA